MQVLYPATRLPLETFLKLSYYKITTLKDLLLFALHL
jgi:hypothetical protein